VVNKAALLMERLHAGSYFDRYDYPAPNPVLSTWPYPGSDNMCMFQAEFVVMLARLGYMENDELDLVRKCVQPGTGLLQRTPVGVHSGLTGPDDYLGALNAFKTYGSTAEARGFLKALWRYKGCLNNEHPGNWSFQSLLIRQPQILCAMITVAFPSFVNPLHWLIRLLAFPLYFYAAVAVGVACIGLHTGATDERRLSWHLAQIIKTHSLMGWIASKVWYGRLYKDYGPTGMKAVAAIYYHGDGVNPHPFAEYWVD